MKNKTRHILTPFANMLSYFLVYSIINLISLLALNFFDFISIECNDNIIRFFRTATCASVATVVMAFVSMTLPLSKQKKHFLFMSAVFSIMCLLDLIFYTTNYSGVSGDLVGNIIGCIIGYGIINGTIEC